MKASELIKAIQGGIDAYGDLDIYSDECYNFHTSCISLEEGSEFPKEYNMPTNFLRLRDDR